MSCDENCGKGYGQRTTQVEAQRGNCLCTQTPYGTVGNGDTVIACVDGAEGPYRLDMFGKCPEHFVHPDNCPYPYTAGQPGKTPTRVVVCAPDGSGMKTMILPHAPTVKAGANTTVSPQLGDYGQIEYIVNAIQNIPGLSINTDGILTFTDGKNEPFSKDLCAILAPLIFGKLQDQFLDLIPDPVPLCDQIAALDEVDPSCTDRVLTLRGDNTCALTRTVGKQQFASPIAIEGSNMIYGHNFGTIDGVDQPDALDGTNPVSATNTFIKSGEIVFNVCDALPDGLCNKPTHVTIGGRANTTIFSATNPENTTIKVNMGGRMFVAVGQSQAGQVGGNNHNSVSPEFDWPLEADGCTVRIPYLIEANIDAGTLDEWRATMNAVIRGAYTAL